MIILDYKVTGSIVTYNNMKTIGDTIESIFKFTEDIDFKLYVVDNKSTDGTPDFIEKNYPQVELIRMDRNVGFGAGHNIVIGLVDSLYHAVINPDILLMENTVKEMSDFLDDNNDIGLLSPNVCFPDGRPQPLGRKDPHLVYIFANRFSGGKPSSIYKKYTLTDKEVTEPVDIENATGCFMMFRTEILKSVGGFDERYFMYFEDADITRTVRKYARVVYHPGITVGHIWKRESKHNYKLLRIHIQSMLKYYLKWKTI